MGKITDIKLYNEQMSHSMKDKLFFLDHIDPKSIDMLVDFGCANGELLRQLPYNCLKIGIDNSKEMREEAEKNYPDATYFNSLSDVNFLNKKNAMINLSSVIHEIYSYLPKNKVDEFWDELFTSGFKYISIRDMMVSKIANRTIQLDDLRKIVNAGYGRMFDEFHNHNLDWRVRDILHFFLKYRYEENWERELGEDYFPITSEELLEKLPDNYKIIYYREYSLDWIKERVKQDFDYDIEDNTHIQLLLERID